MFFVKISLLFNSLSAFYDSSYAANLMKP